MLHSESRSRHSLVSRRAVRRAATRPAGRACPIDRGYPRSWMCLLTAGVITLATLGLGLLAIGGLAAPRASVAQSNLPDFGGSAGGLLTPGEEAAIGVEFMGEVRAVLPLVIDPEVESYIETLGHSLASNSGSPFSFTFFVVAQGDINAFAGPGGYVGVNSGLITATESEGELASVVAHEVAHVSQRHIARAIAESSRSTIPYLAGMLASILLGAVTDANAGQAAAAAVMGISAQKQIDMIRNNELEADRVGMQLLAEGGYNPRAMPEFFEKLQTESRYYRSPPEYLSTHPVTSNRIADTRNRAEQYPYKQVPDGLDYHLVRAKLRVIVDEDPRDTVKFFEGAIKTGRYRSLTGTAYGWGLALTRVGRHDQARTVLEKLAADHPDHPSFQAALADNEASAKRYDRALQIYEDAWKVYPDSRLLVEGYARTLVQTGRGERALELIEDYARIHGKPASLRRLRAEAHSQLGNRVASRLEMAEFYYQSGQLDAAVYQLELAAKEPDDDYYNNVKVMARMKELRGEQANRARKR